MVKTAATPRNAKSTGYVVKKSANAHVCFAGKLSAPRFANNMTIALATKQKNRPLSATSVLSDANAARTGLTTPPNTRMPLHLGDDPNHVHTLKLRFAVAHQKDEKKITLTKQHSEHSLSLFSYAFDASISTIGSSGCLAV